MKKLSLCVVALLAAFVSVAISGPVRSLTPTNAAAASRATACGHYTAVCGGIYNSALPNCSGGPDTYDLDVAAGVHIIAGPPQHSVGDGFPVEVTILTPSGAQGATGVNGTEYTTTEAGLHNIVVSSSQPTFYGLNVSCAPNPGCTPSSTILCLNDDRFSVTTAWRTPTDSGSGTGVKLTGDTGYFWFFNPENVELVTKVLNGCPINNAYWVFAGGLTNVEVVMTVVDTQTGVGAFYVRSAGPAFEPVQDTEALPTCP